MHTDKITLEHASTTPIRVLQITDCHLMADAAATLHEVNTQSSLESVIAHARNDTWPPDLILATGDISQDGSAEAYARFAKLLNATGIPVFCLPGNHDDKTRLKSCATAPNLSHPSIVNIANWRIILLDSALEGSEAGLLSDETLTQLAHQLEHETDCHTGICMHHNPVPANSEWLDTMTVGNNARLFEMTDLHSNIRFMLWGHIHQTFDAERGQVKLMGSPSTCFQFLPKSKDFALDKSTPGYRWLQLYPDGTLDTRVENLPI